MAEQVVAVKPPYRDPLPGHEGTIKDIIRAEFKVKDRPADISDWDIRLLACYDQDFAENAWRQREKARTTPRTKQGAPSPAPPPAAGRRYAVLMTKADMIREDESWGDFVTRCGSLAIPLAGIDAMLAPLREFAVATSKKNQERNSRLDAVEAHNVTLRSLVGDLTQRLEILESRGWKGVWNQERVYQAGQQVTHGGSLWHAVSSSQGRQPGTNSTAWVLSVKRGTR